MLGYCVNDSYISLGSFRMSMLSNPSPIKGYVHQCFMLFGFHSLSKMEATIDIEFLQGINEQVTKEAAVCVGWDGPNISIPPALSYGASWFKRERVELGRWVHPV